MAWREDATITKLRLGEPALVQNVNPKVITGARTILAAENGTTFVLNAAAGAAVTLPAPASGLNFRFVVGAAFATTNWEIFTASAAAIMNGPLTVAGLIVAADADIQVNFVSTAESLGDWVRVESDGTYWYVSGAGTGGGSLNTI